MCYDIWPAYQRSRTDLAWFLRIAFFFSPFLGCLPGGYLRSKQPGWSAGPRWPNSICSCQPSDPDGVPEPGRSSEQPIAGDGRGLQGTSPVRARDFALFVSSQRCCGLTLLPGFGHWRCRAAVWLLSCPSDIVPVLCWFLQVLSAATIVAKHTSALCNACRIASSKTANPVAKRHFVQSAKEVANSTANLVKTIKVQMLLNCASFFLCDFRGFSCLFFFPLLRQSQNS